MVEALMSANSGQQSSTEARTFASYDDKCQMNESSVSNILQRGCENATDYSIEEEPQRFDSAILSGNRASWTRRGKMILRDASESSSFASIISS
ncbi:hypothetical protein TNCT_135181 [Trichonephila clavata]|uniref:Uncharacterized protein n=1 Tax=Trichonephila clavata TaxID=2740835 RepID=A0A8X6HN33_TRICU|nr:hypothetical protein TNCT_135181 [Trichonephila clavata]